MNFTRNQSLSSDWTKWLGEAFEDPKRVEQSILNVMQIMASFIQVVVQTTKLYPSLISTELSIMSIGDGLVGIWDSGVTYTDISIMYMQYWAWIPVIWI